MNGPACVQRIVRTVAKAGRFILAWSQRVGGMESPPPQGRAVGAVQESRQEREPLAARRLVMHADPGRPRIEIVARRQEAPVVVARAGARVVVRPSEAGGAAQGRAPAPDVPSSRITLVPIVRPYWDVNHWKLKGDRLAGFYRTRHGSYEGYINHPKSSRPEFYIVKPPEELRHHRHWICFHHIGGGRYSIHFSPAPSFPDAGILEVEEVLFEALSGQGRRNG